MAKIKSAGAAPSRPKHGPTPLKASRSPRRSLNSRVRKSLLDFTKRLTKLAKGTANLPGANEVDRRILRDDAKVLASSVKSLIRNIESHEACVLWISDICEATRPRDLRDWEAKDPKDKTKLSELGAKLSVIGPFDPLGLVDLSSTLLAAYRIGVHAIESPIFKQLEKDAKAARTAWARQAREPRSKMINDLIREAPCFKQHPERSPHAIASADCSWVNEKLKARGEEPKKGRSDIIGVSALAKRVDKVRKTAQSSN